MEEDINIKTLFFVKELTNFLNTYRYIDLEIIADTLTQFGIGSFLLMEHTKEYKIELIQKAVKKGIKMANEFEGGNKNDSKS